MSGRIDSHRSSQPVDRLGHVLRSDGLEAGGDVLDGCVGGERGDGLPRGIEVERCVSGRAADRWEVRESSERSLAVGHCRRSTASVRGWSRIRTRASGADREHPALH
jgi:hypothetical protein